MVKLRLGKILEHFTNEDVKLVLEALDDADYTRKKQKLDAVFERNEAVLLHKGIMPKYLTYCLLGAVENFKKN